ncbi:hypothetical protein LTR37_008585 [Vermiconidia calcicola]|uniref:Uncharacterized protein n=1 Tax=Vermiconidia calcicola TaxID=1690605 RepID=A0ACC3NDA0_9PEZI|nr:hypothetical protein LTR37_008585 [Vermiconidia calcicola]
MASEYLFHHSRPWQPQKMRAFLYQRSRLWIITCCAIFSLILLVLLQPGFPVVPTPWRRPTQQASKYFHWPATNRTGPPFTPGPCVGPRGGRLDDGNTEDLPHATFNLADTTYPEPTFGSYDTLGLEKSWMTFSQRYGPYGCGEDDEDYGLEKAKWADANWSQLQDQCLLDRSERFGKHETFQTGAAPRFRLLGDGDDYVPRNLNESTGRQAIVLRTWSTYVYKPEDYWNLRSTLTEAALATNGEYTVFLLVDVKQDDGYKIHEDDDFYREVLEASVPREFWDIAVLFHKSLQESWYQKVGEFRPSWQIMQPFQLFAHFYPEFDHYWQFEMDTRFTADAGQMLRAFHKFGSESPYKQARERSSWTYMPSIHGTYEDFTAGVNESLNGDATVWGPIEINAIPKPFGEKPPVDDPTEDDFEWLAGSGADLLLLTPLVDVLRFKTQDDWTYKDWRGGFGQTVVPRFTSAPAQARASWTLLEAIHQGQHEKGLHVPSEATLPSFAMWHGLKVVQVPFPKFQHPARDLEELNMIYNGGPPTQFPDGIANGIAPYRKSAIEWYSRPRTWEWQSSLVGPIFEHWIEGGSKQEGIRHVMHRRDMLQHRHGRKKQRRQGSMGDVPDELPPFMREVDGEVYCPGLLLHPRKTNPHPPALPP